MRTPVKISIHSNSHPYFAPTFELINRLPGPKTTQAVIRAGPIERHHEECRPTVEVSDCSGIEDLALKYALCRHILPLLGAIRMVYTRCPGEIPAFGGEL
jgi:hypothetical protein